MKEGYVVPTFGGDDQGPMAPELQNRLRRPMIVGAVVIGVFVVGMGALGVGGQAGDRHHRHRRGPRGHQRKTLRHRESGTVKQILVQRGPAGPGRPAAAAVQ